MYNLSHAGVESLVERGTFDVSGGQTRHLLAGKLGDVFEKNGRLLPAKQPGQVVLGAMAYAPLHRGGLAYSLDFKRTARLVTWFSTSLLAALAVGCAWALP